MKFIFVLSKYYCFSAMILWLLFLLQPAQANDQVSIAINPGHGVFNDDRDNSWLWQRKVFHELREDIITPEFAIILNQLLKEEGFTTYPLRELNKRAGIGESGLEKWKESAKEYLKGLGDVPEFVWNSSKGETSLKKDIRSRPLYSNYKGASALISIHTNGSIAGDETGEGDLSGTQTFYCRKEGFVYKEESIALAEFVHYAIIRNMRERYDNNWNDGNIWGAFHSENCEADSPAIIVEVAFHDNSFPDAEYLKDHHFRQIAAEGMKDGIKEYFRIQSLEATPNPPAIVYATDGSVPNQIAINWVVTDNTKSYRLYRCTNVEIESCSEIYSGVRFQFSDTKVDPDKLYYYRVKSCNFAGCSEDFSEPSSGFTGEITAFNSELEETESITNEDQYLSKSGGMFDISWLLLLIILIYKSKKYKFTLN